MHRLTFIFLPLMVLGSSSSFAQKHVETGIFLDYLSISKTGTNNFGVGGRFGYRILRNVMMEGELAYDYGLNFDEAFHNIATGKLTAIARTSIGVTHGFFGPKLQSSRGAFRPFITFKGGFVDFRLSPGLVPYSNVVSVLTGIRLQPECGNLSGRRVGSKRGSGRVTIRGGRRDLPQQRRAQQPAHHIRPDS